MAEVFDGFDESLRRPVAIKRLRAEYADDVDLRRRFTREARTGARLAHPTSSRSTTWASTTARRSW